MSRKLSPLWHGYILKKSPENFVLLSQALLLEENNAL